MYYNQLHLHTNLLLYQIKDAKDDNDLGNVAQSDLAIDVFQRCGITQVLKVGSNQYQSTFGGYVVAYNYVYKTIQAVV